MKLHKGTNEYGQLVYRSEDGSWIIDGNGYGRMRWTASHSCGYDGITDSKAEAVAWASEHTC